jgi:hypothetical protein
VNDLEGSGRSSVGRKKTIIIFRYKYVKGRMNKRKQAWLRPISIVFFLECAKQSLKPGCTPIHPPTNLN